MNLQKPDNDKMEKTTITTKKERRKINHSKNIESILYDREKKCKEKGRLSSTMSNDQQHF